MRAGGARWDRAAGGAAGPPGRPGLAVATHLPCAHTHWRLSRGPRNAAGSAPGTAAGPRPPWRPPNPSAAPAPARKSCEHTEPCVCRSAPPARPPAPCGAGMGQGPRGDPWARGRGASPFPRLVSGDLQAALLPPPCCAEGRGGVGASPCLAWLPSRKLCRSWAVILGTSCPNRIPPCPLACRASSAWDLVLRSPGHTPSPGDSGVPSLGVLRLRAVWGSVPLEQHLLHRGPRWGAWSCLLAARGVGDVPPRADTHPHTWCLRERLSASLLASQMSPLSSAGR